MGVVQLNTEASRSPLLDSAWAILEAANDLRDFATVETCRRIIDATYRGDPPTRSDIDVMFDYFK